MSERPLAPIEDRTLRGIALMLAALAGFTGIDTCAKWLVLDGMPTAEVVFVRYLGHPSALTDERLRALLDRFKEKP